MTSNELCKLCLGFSGAVADCPFRNGDAIALRHKENKKWFGLITEQEKGLCINLKCEPSKADFWRSVYPDSVTAGWHMNKRHWISAYPNLALPLCDLQEMICDSFHLTSTAFPHKKSRTKGRKNSP
ncbi:MmcQ/YjbR family DNA-binding protein [Caproicibacterium sp. NSD3]